MYLCICIFYRMTYIFIVKLLVVACLTLVHAKAHESEELSDATKMELVVKHLTTGRMQKCGTSLMETLRMTCEFYDRHLARVPNFVAYLRYLGNVERANYGKYNFRVVRVFVCEIINVYI